jgi:hypothetical protein
LEFTNCMISIFCYTAKHDAPFFRGVGPFDSP